MRVSGPSITKSSEPTVHPTSPIFQMQNFGMDAATAADRLTKAQRVTANIENGLRPTNIWYRATNKASFWYMYATMDWFVREVSVLSTIIHRSSTEIMRYGVAFEPKFAWKCCNCGYESQAEITECPECGSGKLRKPIAGQKNMFVRANGKSFFDEANDNGQSLKDVLKSYIESEYQNNQSYLLCVTGDVVDEDGKLIEARPMEFLTYDPKYVKYLYDDTGRPGTEYAFTRDQRDSLLSASVKSDREEMDRRSSEGKVLYPAVWQIGNSYGGTGQYLLYTKEEIYQDKWFSPSLIYGIPIWFDIQDDLMTYNAMEKHQCKKWTYGFVRKMLILPGFPDEDVEDISKGIQDVLARNDNSIPIVCTPPQMPNTPKMDAQVLELGTESDSDMLQVKDDIRNRLCAHAGVPNIFAGDVEQSGGMNNESQQITVFDRYLMDKYDYLDRLCRWIMSWFPKITDWDLVVVRPSKAYTDYRKKLDRIQEAQGMQALGFSPKSFTNGEFRFPETPTDPNNPQGGNTPTGIEDLPEKGTARREDGEIGASKGEIDLAMKEASAAYDI